MTLYVSCEHGLLFRHRVQVEGPEEPGSPLPVVQVATYVCLGADVASRVDRLRDRGWVECGTCQGTGISMIPPLARALALRHGGSPTERSLVARTVPDESCPGCVDGLVPPDGMIDAAEDGYLDALTNLSDPLADVDAARKAGIRAALVEAARKEEK